MKLPSCCEDVTEAMRRFDSLPNRERLFLWMCAYLDAPFQMRELSLLFNTLHRRVIGGRDILYIETKKMVASFQEAGWLDASMRCPEFLVEPLFLKLMCTYYPQKTGPVAFVEFDRCLEFYEKTAVGSIPVIRPKIVAGQFPISGKPTSMTSLLIMVRNLSSDLRQRGYFDLTFSDLSERNYFAWHLRDICCALFLQKLETLSYVCQSIQAVRWETIPVQDVYFPIPAAIPQAMEEAFCARSFPDNRIFIQAQRLKKAIWYPDADRNRLVDEFDPEELNGSKKNIPSLDVHRYTIQLIHLVLMGKFSDAIQLMKRSRLQWPFHRAWVDLVQGRLEQGDAKFRSLTFKLKPSEISRISLIGCFCGFLRWALRISTMQEAKEFQEIIEKWMNRYLAENTLVERSLYKLLQPLITPIYRNHAKAVAYLKGCQTFDSPVLSTFKLLCMFCLEGALSSPEIQLLQELKSDFVRTRTLWLAAECAAMLGMVGVHEPEDQELLDDMKRREGLVPFVEGLPIESSWKKRVRALVETLWFFQKEKREGVDDAVSPVRIVWRLDVDAWGSPRSVKPYEQKRNVKTGNWTSGKEVSLYRLQGDLYQCMMTDQDREVAACTEGKKYGVGSELNPSRAVVALIGHPHVYSDIRPSLRLELFSGEPELIAEKRDGKVILRLKPNPGDLDVRLIEETPGRYKVVVFKEVHRQIAQWIGAEGFEIPETENGLITEALAAISGVMTVHSAVSFGSEAMEQVVSNPVPIVQISPQGSESLRLSIVVRPFGASGPLLRAGKGTETIVAELDGRHLQTVRRLDEEKRLASIVRERLLAIDSADGADDEWIIRDPEDCLQALVDLRDLQEQNVVIVEWPQGETFKLSRSLSFDRVAIAVRSTADWFEIDGELRIDEERVIGMKQLIDLVAASPGKRFIRMEDGLFLALTSALRKRLDELSAFTEKKGKRLLLHGLAVPAVEDVLQPFQELKTDRKWKERLHRIEEAMRLKPAVPPTLRAELREYQKEGFRWMARLAHMGCGACLADDMGLGKTVQALSMLLHKAAEGPSLVIAPMSVCANWVMEAGRFAPTLRVHTLHVPNRKALIEGLGPMDLLVASYGLLHQEGDILASRTWAVIVLDEAQAIKNMTTKRYQAAVRLQGSFKLITTGTPVENHLGELYTLFQFLNPGLLGSKDRFMRRFITPIERDHDKQAQQRLRKLVKPFILRRLKSQVLDELPPRTDIVLRVELEPEEMALYEAFRRNAVERIARMEGSVEHRRFEILAEILKLRQLCCHPKLVHPEFPDIGSKLKVFGEVVSELIEGGHKALVFSQFLGHLALIRKYLDKAGIAYRYLDGQTPAKQRQMEIESFQAGNGDLFLISLKAGGLGLNLTAADYVIHMDPWWNPAVEDQASDRAHRIGQLRPVTVYRLVAQGTIEEKIVRLHAEKRELAESLLEGTDTGTPLAVEELLQLIREGGD